MHIQELLLDGFKSYPVRTTISDWDPSFNAITGLNGSGKSNILDAICFVLGITNLSAVRAANLQDLIYKRGQAGVTRASVTVIFDNADKSKSPVGMEHLDKIHVTRQISMNKPSKYLVNGHTKTQEIVQNLFQSVQLNINNPNFLIMQGKITKVLNMKPPEILGLIEEAAGTKMYEVKKDTAIKKMQKKDKKLEEISALLEEEIKPKLEQLREEKRRFLEFQRGATELERLSRLVVAHDYVHASKKSAECVATIKEKQQEIKEGERKVKQLKTEISVMQKECKAIVTRRQQELEEGGKIQTLETRSKELAKEIARMNTKVEYKLKSIADATAAALAASATLEELKTATDAKAGSLSALQVEYDAFKEVYDQSSKEIEQKESLLQSLITGLASSDTAAQDSGYMGQLAIAKAKLAEIAANGEQAKVKFAHLTKELKEKEPKAKKAAQDGGSLNRELDTAKANLEALSHKLKKLSGSEESDSELEGMHTEVAERLRDLTARRDSLKSSLGRLNFTYTNPSKDFDRARVKGCLGNLVNLPEKHSSKSTALEVCAGSKLYNVVVDDDATGSELLNKGNLTQRVTLIPLNKINANSMPVEKVEQAKKVSANKAALALSLIEFPKTVAPAMSYVFGSTFICADPVTAKAVCFDQNIRAKTVTVEGDVYNPSGSLEGGAAPANSDVLVKVKRLQEVEQKLDLAQVEFEDIDAQWQQVQTRQADKAQLQMEVDLKAHEVKELEARHSDSSAARIIAEVAAIRGQLEELTQSLADNSKMIQDADMECSRIQREMDEFADNRESKLKELKSQIAVLKSAFSKHNLKLKTFKSEVQTADLEFKQMKVDVAAAEAEVQYTKSSITDVQAERQIMAKELEHLLSEQEEIDLAYREETKQLTAINEELAELESAISLKANLISTAGEDELKLANEIERLQKESEKGTQILKTLLQTWPWIVDEKDNFGVPGSSFDFDNVRMDEMKKQCTELQDRQNSQKKKVNPKVMNMIDNVEKKQLELTKMHAQVVKDRSKIEETIAKLDNHKREALQKTWTVVNDNFGAIFGELLPGNFARLDVPEDMDITEGLEVKVRLGQVWKQSLTELSGGQRSLIALSLIMSLLQFKPAPMYILDEVDAALDLSHTQHIGQLFRNRFKGSQFIVISLKEGLFTNANVLFRARFVDGTSTVERQARGYGRD